MYKDRRCGCEVYVDNNYRGRQLTSRFRKRSSGFQRFRTNSLQFSIVCFDFVDDEMRTGIPDDELAEIAFLRMRPAAVGRAAPRMDKGSEGPTCVVEVDMRAGNCVDIRGMRKLLVILLIKRGDGDRTEQCVRNKECPSLARK
jgi:hypothetical protein